MSVRYWRVALVLWMGLIFTVSSSLLAPQMSFDGTEEVFGSVNYFVRKFAHLAEYAVLTYLWLRSICTAPGHFRGGLFWGAALSTLYAVTDEAHQYFVPHREGVWTDVVWDAAGALAAVYVLWEIRQRGSADLRRRVLGPLGDPGESGG